MKVLAISLCLYSFKDDNEQYASSRNPTYDSWESDFISRFITPSVQVSYKNERVKGLLNKTNFYFETLLSNKYYSKLNWEKYVMITLSDVNKIWDNVNKVFTRTISIYNEDYIQWNSERIRPLHDNFNDFS